MSPDPVPNAFARHDHRRCRIDAMQQARAHCRAAGLRLTPVRARVLELLLENHRALGAYELLQRLDAEGLGSQPPVVYRALDFLGRQGLVHKVERLNAFTACCQTDPEHEPMFLICEDCHRVAETPLKRLMPEIDRDARALGFRVKQHVVEVLGRCGECHGSSAQ